MKQQVNSGTEPKQFKHLKIYVKTTFLNSVSLTMRIQGRASNENMAYTEAVLLLMLLKCNHSISVASVS